MTVGLDRFLTALVGLCLFAGILSLHATPGKDSPDSPLTGAYPGLQDGKPIDLAQFRGLTVLVVNTASKCGYTGQYEDLEALYAKYKERGFVVLGFPSNSFKQEYASDQQISDFCKNTYAIEFPMFSSVDVTGPNMAPLFRVLADQTGQPVRWNFNKYLIGRDGHVIRYFPSQISPLNTELEDLIRSDLGI
jgi:glutathione peroxidase